MVHDLHFSLSYILDKNSANTGPCLMDQEHYPSGFSGILAEDLLENFDDKLHSSIIIIMEKNLIHGRQFEFLFDLLFHILPIIRMMVTHPFPPLQNNIGIFCPFFSIII